MAIKMIIATGLNGEIGKNNKLLFHCKEDMQYFKEQTSGVPVVMGRKTFESLNRKDGLPNRNNIVLTSDERLCNSYLSKNKVNYVNSVDKLIDFIIPSAERVLDKDVWIIGGKQVYEEFKDIVEEVHWTKVDKTFEDADTFFDMSWVRNALRWEKVSSKELTEDVRVNVYKKIC